jgi:hypothetical protein
MMTKKTLFILLTCLLICPAMHSQQNVNQLFSAFSKEKGVTRVGLGKFTMTLASLFTDVMGVNGIEVLSFDECNPSVKERLNAAIASLKDEQYETMISVNEEKERTKILVKLEDESIRELIVMTSGDTPALIRIKGKIKPSDIENVVNQNKK